MFTRFVVAAAAVLFCLAPALPAALSAPETPPMDANNIAVPLADAIVAELNAHTFDPPFTATRSWAPTQKLKDSAPLRVTVAYASAVLAKADRVTVEGEHSVEIGIQQHLGKGAADNAAVDPLVALVEAVNLYLQKQPLTAMPQASWVRAAILTPCLAEHIRELNVFSGVLQVTYKIIHEDDDE